MASLIDLGQMGGCKEILENDEPGNPIEYDQKANETRFRIQLVITSVVAIFYTLCFFINEWRNKSIIKVIFRVKGRIRLQTGTHRIKIQQTDRHTNEK